MSNRIAWLITIGLIIVPGTLTEAQQRPAPGTGTAAASPVDAGITDISRGWAALQAGHPDQADAAAARLLQRGVRRHDALSLMIEARVQAGRIDAALDGYERWLRTVPQEDVFLLQPIARGRLRLDAQDADAGIRVAALQALSSVGDATATAALRGMAGTPSGTEADAALADSGDAAAAERLASYVSQAGPRADLSAPIDALVRGKATQAAPQIAAALDASRPLPTRIAAARALGQLNAMEAIPQLRTALQDPDPPVRMAAAAALSRLGDQSGATLLQQMQNSPVPDIRLMAVEDSVAREPAGTWVAVANQVMDGPDPLARLDAASLLARYSADPARGYQVLTQALADPAPAVRFVAAQELRDIPPRLLGSDLPTLRRLLRDPERRVRIAAAGALLRLAGGVE